MTIPSPDPSSPLLTRRVLLWDLGAAVAMLALAGCTSSESATDGGTAGATGAAAPTGTSPTPTDPDAIRWERVIGGASGAYVVVRGGEATIVDTGQPGTEGAITDGLAAVGLDWDAVGRVVLTHSHPDHVGSLDAVAGRAADAALLAGEGDIAAIAGPRTVTAIGNGMRVMDLDVIETPGHTPGHISLFDAGTRLLVAGDAINGTEDGGVNGPNQAFTPDMDTAWTSAAALARLQPDTILFGHGPPATTDAASALDTVVADSTQG